MQGYKIYVAGYNTATTNTLQCVYVYDVATNCWDRLPNPGQYYGVPHIIGGKLCIIGGRLCSTWERTNQIATLMKPLIYGNLIILTYYQHEVDRV